VGHLLSRGKTHFDRIEEFLNGMIDSLFLTDPLLFINDSESLKTIKTIVRKVFKVGTYNLVSLVDMWKSFTAWAVVQACDYEVEEVQRPENNIFWRLLDISRISLIIYDNETQKDLVDLAHLTSTRQMPYMGSATERKSIDAFIKVITDSIGFDECYNRNLYQTAIQIGKRCRALNSDRRLPATTAHVSVTSSGDYSFSITDGGQAQACRSALIFHLDRIPDEDREEDTPFGKAVLKAGIPAWQTVFVPEDDIDLGSPARYLESYSPNKDGVPQSFGLDSRTGKQLLYAAWKDYLEYKDEPIPCRAEVIPEMGNKARMVTITPYWVNVLMAPLSHTLINAMRFHPYVYSSFTRQDQCWEAVKQIHGLDRTQWFLSSDLKDATNRQEFQYSRTLISGFMTGYGIKSNQYTDLVLSMIRSRLVEFPDRPSVITSRSVMMGEAIAKPSLTLNNLVNEELSYRRYLGESLIKDWSKIPQMPWRKVHIGGDDHLLHGPKTYLKYMTANLIRSGAMISIEKHGISRKAVKYTEKFINVRNIRKKVPLNKGDPNDAIIVDSIKVRLLERGLSTLLAKDNKNVAVGKAGQFCRTTEWLPPSLYPHGSVEAYRELFIKRMGTLLPSRHVNPRAFAQVFLPLEIGGYGLGRWGEVIKYLKDSPLPIRRLIGKIFLGADVGQELSLLRRINTNPSRRGVRSDKISDFRELLIGQLNDYPSMVNAIGFKELRERFPGDDPRDTLRLASGQGWLSFEDYADFITRGIVFRELLTENQGRKDSFNSRPMVRTMSHIWDELMDLTEGFDEPDWNSLSAREVKFKIFGAKTQWFFDTTQSSCFDSGSIDPETGEEEFEFYEAPFISGWSKGQPSMVVNPSFIGLPNHLIKGRIPKDLL